MRGDIHRATLSLSSQSPFLFNEDIEIERLWLSRLLALDDRCPDGFYLGLTLQRVQPGIDNIADGNRCDLAHWRLLPV